MAYRPPTYNLQANVWNNGTGAGPPTLAGVLCQLRGTLHANSLAGLPGTISFDAVGLILFPALTDVRGTDKSGPGAFSVIECPAASGRMYTCVHMEDQAKGFPNESRCAYVQQRNPWPIPTP